MFEVKVMTDSKKLGDLLMAMDGLVYGHPEVTPVRGAKVKKGEVVASSKSKLTLMEVIVKFMNDKQLSLLHPRDAARAVEAAGFKAASYSNALMRLRGMKIFGKVNNDGEYPFNLEKAKAEFPLAFGIGTINTKD